MTTSQPDPLLIEMNHAARRMKIKHFIHRLVFIAVALQGLRHLFVISKEIFFVYPKISAYFLEAHFSQSVYMQVVQQAALVSVTGFLETAVGLAMLIKETHTIKTVHAVVGVALFLLSYYLRREGAVLDFKTIEELSFMAPLF